MKLRLGYRLARWYWRIKTDEPTYTCAVWSCPRPTVGCSIWCRQHNDPRAGVPYSFYPEKRS